MTGSVKNMQNKEGLMNISTSFICQENEYVLFLVDGFELDRRIGILSPAGGTSAIEVFLDMVPAEPTDLRSRMSWKEAK